MGWKVDFYNTKVEKNIEEWPVHLRVKFLKIVDLIKEVGPYELGMPHIKSLKQGLSEIRVRGVEGIARAFLCYKRENCDCAQRVYKEDARDAAKRNGISLTTYERGKKR